jgi:hypothetical protein
VSYSVRPLRFSAKNVQRRQRRADACRRQTGIEDERARAVHQVRHDSGRSENGAALAAQRLGQGHRRDHVVGSGQPLRSQQSTAARSAHAKRVRLVHHQHRASPAAHLVQRPQRSQIAIDTIHRIGHDQRALLAALGQHPVHRGDVVVRHHGDPRPRQPARVHQRGVIRGVGHDQRASPRQRRQHTEVRRVSGGEHQCSFGTAEVGEFSLERRMQLDRTGDQPGAGRPGPPGLHGVDRRGHDPWIAREPEVVVARQIEQAVVRPSRPQLATQTCGPPHIRVRVEPGQGALVRNLQVELLHRVRRPYPAPPAAARTT